MKSKDFYKDLKLNMLKFAKSLNLDAVGVTNFPLPLKYQDEINEQPACPFTSGSGYERLNAGTDDKSLIRGIVVLFPYYVQLKNPNIIPNLARYTWGDDYHDVARKYLTQIIDFLKKSEPNANFEIHVDTSPLADRKMAIEAGLGFIGKNRCFIHPKFGSYVSIASILTSIPLPADAPMNKTCLNCGACLQACPGQALQENRFCFENCKSYITQKKGEFTKTELAIMRKTPLIFGCDVCQEVCPHNRQAQSTPIPEFQNILTHIEESELNSMTNKEFKIKYGHKAFAWRGKKVLLRNIDSLK